MKPSIQSITAGLLAGMALVALCGTARADLTVTNSTTTGSWNQVGGQNPFYVSLPSAGLTGFSAQGQPGAGSGALYTVLSETFTITNGAGGLANGSTNYLLTAIAIVGSGQPANSSIHLYDVTTNLTSNNGTPLNGSGATYNFTANGDLLGNGHGLSFSNTLSGMDQVLYSLSAGPGTQDQVVLGRNHTYALEFWTPTSGGFSWDRTSGVDAGGQGMGSGNAGLGTARTTLTSLGLAGGAPRTFTLALYGSATSSANSVNSSTNPAAGAATISFVVDDFSPAGVSSANPTNYDYYSSVQNYAAGSITNVYGNWFGGAFQSLSWDSTSDASNNAASGSLKVNLNWSSVNSQFVVWDQGEANDYYALKINALYYTNFQCDVRFAPGSASDTGNASQAIFGHLRFGDRTASYGQDWFGAVDVAATNTNWVHVSITLNAITDTNLLNIQGLIFGIDESYYSLNLNGASTLWVDNIKFTAPGTVVTQAAPVLAMSPAVAGLRIFAGSSLNTYDREELATVDSSQSWIGGSYPVSYSFKLLDYPANIGQTHIFLVPVNTSGQSSMGNNGSVNEYIDYQASNTLSMLINPAGSNVIASVQWKVNLANANPNNTAVTITNATAVGTWTLTFNTASSGTLTAPGASPVAFTIADPNVATDFGNPLVAYFGLQPNSTAGEGEYEDWASITVTGVAGAKESDIFAADASFNPNGYWANNSESQNSLQLVSASMEPAYWVNWTLPALGYALGASDNLNGSTVAPYPWVVPEYYNNYNGSGNGTVLPGIATQGLLNWVLVPSTCLPTGNGQPYGNAGAAPATNAFFKLFNPALQN